MLIALGANCPQLRELYLAGNLEMSDKGIHALLEGCPALSKLMLCTRSSRFAFCQLTLTPGCVDALNARGHVKTFSSRYSNRLDWEN